MRRNTTVTIVYPQRVDNSWSDTARVAALAARKAGGVIGGMASKASSAIGTGLSKAGTALKQVNPIRKLRLSGAIKARRAAQGNRAVRQMTSPGVAQPRILPPGPAAPPVTAGIGAPRVPMKAPVAKLTNPAIKPKRRPRIDIARGVAAFRAGM